MNALDEHGNRAYKGNKNGWLYCICLKFTEFIAIVQILLIPRVKRKRWDMRRSCAL
jgi:hypothetical protein